MSRKNQRNNNSAAAKPAPAPTSPPEAGGVAQPGNPTENPLAALPGVSVEVSTTEPASTHEQPVDVEAVTENWDASAREVGGQGTAAEPASTHVQPTGPSESPAEPPVVELALTPADEAKAAYDELAKMAGGFDGETKAELREYDRMLKAFHAERKKLRENLLNQKLAAYRAWQGLISKP